MIEVNLLPEEFRKVDKTPLPVFLSIIGSIVLVLGAAFGYVFFQFVVVEEKNEELKRARFDAQRYETIVEDIIVLKKDYKNDETRLNTILQIRKSQILWGKKLAQLCTLTPADIWYERITMEQLDVVKMAISAQAKASRSRRNKKKKLRPIYPDGGDFTIFCRQRGENLDKMDDFQQELSNHKMFSLDFLNVDWGTEGYRRIDEKRARLKDQKTLMYNFYLKIVPPEAFEIL